MKYINTCCARISDFIGSAWGFVYFLIILMLSLYFNFWNEYCTIIGYVLLLILQNSNNRDTKAIEKKLDELIKAHPDADNKLRGIENE